MYSPYLVQSIVNSVGLIPTEVTLMNRGIQLILVKALVAAIPQTFCSKFPIFVGELLEQKLEI